MAVELTTVADDAATFHDGTAVDHVEDLEPGTEHERHGITFRTLERPPGRLRCRFGTVNDVHFGETEAGRIEDLTEGPIRRVPPGAEPYPETMNRATVAEMAAADLAAVDRQGRPDHRRRAGRVRRVRGVLRDRRSVTGCTWPAATTTPTAGRREYAGDEWIELPGVAVALLDTAIPTVTSGHLSAEQIDWLDARAADSTVPVIAMGHHQQWVGGERSPEYFGIDPDSSDALTAVMTRRPAHRRLHRRAHPPAPGPARRAGHPVDRGRVRQGLPGDVGRVPGLRRRHPAGRPPDVVAGGAGLERAVPDAVLGLRRGLRVVRHGHARRPLLRHPAPLTAGRRRPAAVTRRGRPGP